MIQRHINPLGSSISENFVTVLNSCFFYGHSLQTTQCVLILYPSKARWFGKHRSPIGWRGSSCFTKHPSGFQSQLFSYLIEFMAYSAIFFGSKDLNTQTKWKVNDQQRTWKKDHLQ